MMQLETQAAGTGEWFPIIQYMPGTPEQLVVARELASAMRSLFGLYARVTVEAATIRAERVAPDHQAVTLTIHQALAPWHMSIATAMGSQEHYNELLATIADALIASGVLGNTYRNPYQAETLQGLRESGNGEMHDLGSFAEPATADREAIALPVEADTYRNSYQKEQTDEQ